MTVRFGLSKLLRYPLLIFSGERPSGFRMYIDKIVLRNFRSFRKPKWISFISTPKQKNVNLLLGNNGAGKTTLLKAISLVCLGPAVGRSGIYAHDLITELGAPLEGGSKTQTRSRTSRLSKACIPSRLPYPVRTPSSFLQA